MQIVGQRTVLNHINELISEDKLPHFIILTGPVGSGKKTIAKYIADSLGVEFVLYGNKVDDIRSLIDLCYSQTDNIVYCISDGQDMSVIAKKINDVVNETEFYKDVECFGNDGCKCCVRYKDSK